VPVLIDPAVYYGDREADLAMTALFGGFPPRFYEAYREAFPLAPGYEARQPLYQLYYLLCHLNLFGEAYGGSVDSILHQFV
jgi:fructosamine-3-kinase